MGDASSRELGDGINRRANCDWPSNHHPIADEQLAASCRTARLDEVRVCALRGRQVSKLAHAAAFVTLATLPSILPAAGDPRTPTVIEIPLGVSRKLVLRSGKSIRKIVGKGQAVISRGKKDGPDEPESD